MDIEPIRLDTNLLNSALQVKMHQQGQEELQRHHAILETGSAQKLELDAAEQVIKDPDASPFQKYQAANARYHAMAPGHGDLPPIDYSDNAPDWNNFVLNLNTKGSQSPEVMQSMQRLSQNSPYFRQKAEAAMKQKQQTELRQGMQSLPTRAGQPALSPEESLAAQHSAPLQKAIGESAFPSPKETAVMDEVKDRRQYLQTQEATLTQAHKALDTAVTPVFHAESEERLQQALSTRKVTGALGYDQSANDAGALTTEERNAAKQSLPVERQQLNQQERQLMTELNSAKHDITGKARPVEQIKAQLDAVRMANFIKGKELAYAQQGTVSNLNAMKQAYAQHDQTLNAYTQQIKALRQASLSVAQGSLNEKMLEYQNTQDYKHKLVTAQSEFSTKTDLTPKAAGAIAFKHGVLTEDVLKAAKTDHPLVTNTINAEKSYGTAFADKVATQDVSLQDSAMKAPDLANRSIRIQEMIHSGAAITGTGAEFRLQFAKAMKLAGLSDSDAPEITESLATDLASNTLDSIKASGLGGGTGFSNADRDFLEKAKGGKITLEKETLLRLSTLAHRAAENTAKRWNARVKQIPNSALEGTGVTREEVHVQPLKGGPSAQAGTVAPFNDAEKERRYQEWKTKHK